MTYRCTLLTFYEVVNHDWAAFFTPLESHAARSGDDGCSFFQRTRCL